MVQNLLLNAVKFSENNKIEINTKFSFKTNVNLLIVEVSDKGVGIEEDEKVLMFKKFGKLASNSNLNPNGVGLGLYISKNIAKLSGGLLSFDSRHNFGSTFKLVLPVEMVADNDSTKQNGSYGLKLEEVKYDIAAEKI